MSHSAIATSSLAIVPATVVDCRRRDGLRQVAKLPKLLRVVDSGEQQKTL
jgi:hypothetical protein